MKQNMADRPLLLRPLVAGLFVLVTLPAVLAVDAGGQGRSVDSIDWKRGYNGLAMLCRAANLRIHNDLQAWTEVPPNRSMLIVLGSTRSLPIDAVNFVSKGGAALVASDQQDYLSLLPWAVALNRGPHHAVASADMFRKRSDCPIVTELDRDHPVTRGCESLVTNRPGVLALRLESASRGNEFRRTIATLPVLRGQPRTPRGRPTSGPALAVALEWEADARAVCVSDPSIFSNQMLTCGDNAEFAINAISWLRAETRTHVLIIVDRQVTDPTNPDQLFVLVPPPDPEDVVAALEQLPPETLIAFGNSVIAAVEDEGVVNDVIPDIVSEIPGRLYVRILILMTTALLFVFLAVRLFNRRAEWLAPARLKRNDRLRAKLERGQAAAVLLDQFRGDMTGSLSTPWQSIVNCIRLEGRSRATKRLQREITRVVRRFSQESRRYWTHRRLTRLQRQIAHWRQLHASGLLEYHSG